MTRHWIKASVIIWLIRGILETQCTQSCSRYVNKYQWCNFIGNRFIFKGIARILLLIAWNQYRKVFHLFLPPIECSFTTTTGTIVIYHLSNICHMPLYLPDYSSKTFAIGVSVTLFINFNRGQANRALIMLICCLRYIPMICLTTIIWII